MDRLRRFLTNRTFLACLAALSMMAAGFTLAAPNSAAATPTIAKADLEWHDGYNHYILTPTADATTAAAASDSTHPPSMQVTTSTSSAPVGPAAENEDPSRPKSVPSDAIATRTPDGKKLWLLQDGTLVDENGVPVESPSARPSPSTTSPTAPTAPSKQAENPPADKPLTGGASGLEASKNFAERVATWPGIVKATPLNGGLVQISTTMTRQELEIKPGVDRVDTDQLLQLGTVANGSPNDPLFDKQWMLDNTGSSQQAGGAMNGVSGADTKAPKAWSKATGQGVVVADLDSGVQLDHPDLAPQIWHKPGESCGNSIDDDGNGYVDDCNGWDAGSNDNNPNPDVGGSFGAHGTHVAGIIGAKADNGVGIAGMAPNVRIMAVKISNNNNLATGSILNAVMYAVDNGAKVINASWGTAPGTPRGGAYIMEQAVQYAKARNVLFVAASGNDGTNIDSSASWPASFGRYYDNVLTVGASTNADTIASFSNYGPSTVGIFAPGWFINSTVPGSGYGMMSGTSMATPSVVGAAALVVETAPSAGPAAWITRLKTSVDNIPALYGFSQTSRLNAASAVGAASDPFSVDYHGFLQWLPSTPFGGTATLHFNDPTLVSAGDQVRGTLITPEGNSIYAVSGAEIGALLGSALTTTMTDDSGTATLVASLSTADITAGAASGLDLEIISNLPKGDYGLLLRVTDANGIPRMNGSSVYMNIDNPPPTSGGAPGNTPTTSAPGGGGNWTTTSTTPSGSGGGNGGGATTTTVAGSSTTSSTTPGGSGGSGGSGGATTTSTVRYATTTTAVAPSTTTTRAPSATTTTTAPSTPTTRPGGGSATTTTTRAPGGIPTTPNTTAPGGGNGGVTVTTTVGGGSGSGPAPVSSGGWTIASRHPATGSQVGGTTVMITGTFPNYANAAITMGGTAATVFYATPNSIWFIAPAHAPGLVNIGLTAPGISLTMNNAFTYLSSASAGSGGGGSGGNSTTTTTTTVGGGSGGGNSGGSSGGGSSTPTTAAPPLYRNNLKLVKLPTSDTYGSFSATAWPARTCTQMDCRGVSVR